LPGHSVSQLENFNRFAVFPLFQDVMRKNGGSPDTDGEGRIYIVPQEIEKNTEPDGPTAGDFN
jgi:hypothetical protein